MSAETRPPIDYAALADTLAALAYPLRLEILDVLDRAHTLSEIRVRPHRQAEGGNPERVVAKQTVAEHLERLVEAGFVAVGEHVEGARTLPTYAVDPSRLFAFTEEMRALVVKHSGRGRGAEATGTLDAGLQRQPKSGPRFVLVHGVYESRAYPLDATTETDGAWLVGRARGLAVSLDYDPFVSLRNTLVTRRDDRFHLMDEGSKNGTMVNWRRLAEGESATLRRGDIVGVGRSLLAFYDG